MEEQQVETTIYSLTDAPPERADRREGERHLTLLRVGAVTIGDRRELCLIKNISAGGMSIRAYCVIEPGTRLSIELKCGQPVTGTARWADGNVVGVAFDSPVDVVDLLATSMDGPRPRMPRIEVGTVAYVRQGADTRRVRACDVSQGGIKLESPAELLVGSDVVVTLAGLSPQPATVRWKDGNCYGVTFNKVVPLPELVSWLQAQRDRLRAAS